MATYTIPTEFVAKSGRTMQARRAITPGMDKMPPERTGLREQARHLRQKEARNAR